MLCQSHSSMLNWGVHEHPLCLWDAYLPSGPHLAQSGPLQHSQHLHSELLLPSLSAPSSSSLPPSGENLPLSDAAEKKGVRKVSTEVLFIGPNDDGDLSGGTAQYGPKGTIVAPLLLNPVLAIPRSQVSVATGTMYLNTTVVDNGTPIATPVFDNSRFQETVENGAMYYGEILGQDPSGIPYTGTLDQDHSSPTSGELENEPAPESEGTTVGPPLPNPVLGITGSQETTAISVGYLHTPVIGNGTTIATPVPDIPRFRDTTAIDTMYFGKTLSHDRSVIPYGETWTQAHSSPAFGELQHVSSCSCRTTASGELSDKHTHCSGGKGPNKVQSLPNTAGVPTYSRNLWNLPQHCFFHRMDMKTPC